MKCSPRFPGAVISTALVTLLVAGQSNAAVLYGHGNFDYTLYTIDTVTQTVTAVGYENVRWGPEIQLNTAGDTIYMSNRDGPLRLINPSTGLNTGALSLLGFPTDTNTPTALEFVGNTLYGSFHQAGPESGAGVLGTIDTSTGAITTIGTMTGMIRPTGGLHYLNGTLYGVSSTNNNDSSLYTINQGTGAATLVGPLTLGGVQQDSATALAYGDGKMYTLLTDDVDTNLYSIDLSNGNLTQEFDLGVTMNSLTSTSAIPEPFTVAWVGMLIGAGFVSHRVRRPARR